MADSAAMLWLLEPDVFAVGPHPLAPTITAAGHSWRSWDEDWWSAGAPAFDGPVVFHGSLGNAARIAALGRWRPGAYCNTAEFHCSRFYPAASKWLVHRDVLFTTVAELSANPIALAGSLADDSGRVFVRPDSPLKPFAGRVVALEGLSPTALDHGFYYEDLDLPIVVSRTQALATEWRFVVAAGEVVTGCAYQAAERSGVMQAVEPAASALAREIAASFVAPDPVYVLDLVASDAGLRMLEINPFGGADLYACDLAAIVAAVSRAAGLCG